jgi:hypothetical protein
MEERLREVHGAAGHRAAEHSVGCEDRRGVLWIGDRQVDKDAIYELGAQWSESVLDEGRSEMVDDDHGSL